ncbi:hypothetical protein [Arthrobacter agilis]|jgi:hypothetical protein|uniref:hypothetical protein n=1 Tax=Arthrobacter agilis TaxID=37921 RepID=UPI002784C1FD|nr:hypothetical protein [Arthrobacter agilis]MDQ0735886.1 hypothetical protein [Arthrobacter agilis]
MSETPRRRYQIRLRRAVAGSFLAAATAATLTGFTAAPALAVPPRVQAVSADTTDYEAGDVILGLDSAAAVTVASPLAVAGVAPSPAERLAGVRADLDRAVLLRMVTPAQADGFYAQIERRVAAGL